MGTVNYRGLFEITCLPETRFTSWVYIDALEENLAIAKDIDEIP